MLFRSVLSGISEGDKVIVRGVGLVDGTPVRVIDAPANTAKAQPNASAAPSANPTSTISATSPAVTPQRAAEGTKP